MATIDPLQIGRLAARLETVTEKRCAHEAAVDHLTKAYTTYFDQWGHFLDQTSTALFGSQYYLALYQEASKALNDACKADQQRKQEQAHLDRLRSQEQTLRRKLLKAHTQNDLQELKTRWGESEG